MRFIIDNQEYYCKRSTNNQGTIEFNGVELKPRVLHDKLLKLCFGLAKYTAKYDMDNFIFKIYT